MDRRVCETQWVDACQAGNGEGEGVIVHDCLGLGNMTWTRDETMLEERTNKHPKYQVQYGVVETTNKETRS